LNQVRNFSTQPRRRRALLYVPGSEERFLRKATDLNVDTVNVFLFYQTGRTNSSFSS
jgi:hypothetical protein